MEIYTNQYLNYAGMSSSRSNDVLTSVCGCGVLCACSHFVQFEEFQECLNVAFPGCQKGVSRLS